MFNDFYDAYYNSDLKKINRISETKADLVKKLDRLVEKNDGKILLQVSMALRCIQDSLGSLIGLIIN